MSGKHKLSDEDLDGICRMIESGASQMEIADAFGVSKSAAQHIWVCYDLCRQIRKVGRRVLKQRKKKREEADAWNELYGRNGK